MELLSGDIAKLLFAAIIGAIVGAEREIRSKAAGFRTIILICLGSTLFTIISVKVGGVANPDRIAASIITGIGFIGAGAIFRAEGHVSGITTAATIWIAAALGMSIGAGHFLLAGFTTLVVIVVLWLFANLDALIDNAWQSRGYEIVLRNRHGAVEKLTTLFHDCNLRTKERGVEKRSGDLVVLLMDARGKAKSHQLVSEKLLADTEVAEFRF